MRNYRIYKAFLMCFLFVFSVNLFSQEQLPSAFTLNEGQLPKDVIFDLNISNTHVNILKNGISFGREKFHNVDYSIHENQLYKERMIWNLNFIDANDNSTIEKSNETTNKVNYLIGKDKSKWLKGIKSYSEVVYRNIYNNIDLQYYTLNNELKYDFILHHSANINDIKLNFEGINSLNINDKGQLVVTTPWGDYYDETPYCYQIIDDEKVEVEVNYTLVNETTFSFKILGDYNPNLDLIIDPFTLKWMIYAYNHQQTIGNGGRNDCSYGSVTDAEGNTYVTGAMSGGWGTTPGVFQDSIDGEGITYDGSYDVEGNSVNYDDGFVVKIDPDGNFVYATYIGGYGHDISFDIAIKSNGQVVIAGYAGSYDFPTTTGAFQTNQSIPDTSQYGNAYGPGDGFVTILNQDGTDLVASTLIGGGRNEIIHGLELYNDYVYVVGDSHSYDLPLQNPFQNTLHTYSEAGYVSSEQDGFVAKFTPDLSSLVFSTYLGGSGDEFVSSTNVVNQWDITTTATGKAVVVGYTKSTGFAPNSTAFPTTANAQYNPIPNTGIMPNNGFITIFSNDGSSLEYSSFLPNIILDKVIKDKYDDNTIYVLGRAIKDNQNLVTQGTYQTTFNSQQTSSISGVYWPWELVISAIDINDGHTIRGTYFGSIKNDDPWDMFMKDNGAVIVTGVSFSNTVPMVCDMPQLHTTAPDDANNNDVFIAEFCHDLDQLVFSTWWGGNEVEQHGAYVSFDKNDMIVSGSTWSSDIPTTDGSIHTSAWTSNTYDENGDNVMVLRLKGPDFTYDTTCTLLKHFDSEYEDCNVDSVSWNFGDPASGSANISHLDDPEHTFSASGTYDVQFYVFYKCLIDTVEKIVTVTDNDTIEFDLGPDTSLCTGSLILNPNFTGTFYNWNTGETTQTISVEQPGQYILTAGIDSMCIGIDTINILIGNMPIVDLGPDTSICSGTSYILDAGNPGATYLWSDGSTDQTLTVTSSGTYFVTVNDGGCEGIGQVTINLGDISVDLGQDISVCEPNTVIFDAGNTGATYLWSDGSGNQTLNVSASGTYYVTVTTSDGCVGEDSVVATITPLPVVDLGPDTSICSGASYVLDAGNTGATYLWSDGSINQTFTVTNSGTYSVTVTNNTCEASDEVEITLGDINVDLGQDISVCEPNTITFDAGNAGATYLWSDGSGSQTLNVSASGTYYVTVTTSDGCVGKDSVVATIIPLPVVDLGQDITVCAPSTVDLDAGNTGSTYLWSDGSSSQTLNVSASGTYSVTVTNNTCEASDEVEITINPIYNIIQDTVICENSSITYPDGNTEVITANTTHISNLTTVNSCDSIITTNVTMQLNPTPDISGYDFCQGLPATLDAGSGYNTYEWNTTDSTQLLTVNVGGLYSVTVSDIYSCIGTDAISVVVFPLPIPTITGDNFCEGTTTSLSTDTGYVGYLWNTNDTTSQVTVASGGNYIVTITDHNGCSASTSINIVQYENPQPNIAAITPICEGETTSLDAGVFNQYDWSTNDTNQSIVVSTQGVYSVVVTDDNGCIGADDIEIMVIQNPTPQIIGDSNVCEGESAILSVDGTYNLYQWTPSGTEQSISVNTSGTYTVEVTDLFGCTGNASFDFAVNPNPSPIITGNLDICEGQQTVLDAGSGYATYSWNNNLSMQSINVSNVGNYSVTVTDNNECIGIANVTVNVDNPQITAPDDQIICNGSTINISAIANSGVAPYTYYWTPTNSGESISVSPATETTYSVYMVDAMGCTSNTENITISVSPNVELETYANRDTVCPGDPVTITNNISSGMSPYTLYNDVGDVITGNDIVYPNTPTVYSYTVVDACGSTANNIVSIYTYPIPQLSFTADILEGCPPLTVHFNQNQYNTSYDYLWGFDVIDENNLSLAYNPIHTFDYSGYYDISVQVTDIHGCKNQLTIPDMIHVYPQPDAKFYVDTDVVDFIDPVIAFNNYSVDNYTNIWGFGDGDSSLLENPVHKYQEIGYYYPNLVVVNEYGCKDTAVKQIEVRDVFTLYVPTAFSPDNDVVNDGFRAVGHGIDLDNYHIAVYDRWGEIIWESTDMFEYWDGYAKGGTKKSEIGSYVWKVVCKDFKGNEHEKAGVVTLIR